MLQEADVAKNCNPGVNMGAVSGRKLSKMSNGTYYFVLVTNDDSKEIKSKIDKLIIMK